MRNYSKFIPGEEISAFEQWDFGAVDTASLLLAAQVKAREEASDAVKNDAIRQAGYAEGFAQGHAQATLEGQRQISEFIATQGREAALQFAAIFESVQKQLTDSEQVMAQGVLELACEVARQVLRQELAVNQNVLKPVISEALGVLVADSKAALVRLNPQDLKALQGNLEDDQFNLSLTLRGDESITRGGCLIESAGTVVDGTLEKRWARAIASLGLSSVWEEVGDEQ
jgi:flagellar assembly protein FliH